MKLLEQAMAWKKAAAAAASTSGQDTAEVVLEEDEEVLSEAAGDVGAMSMEAAEEACDRAEDAEVLLEGSASCTLGKRKAEGEIEVLTAA